MQKGDVVRVTQIPEGLPDADDLRTKAIFELCLGRSFPIAGIERGLVQLDVGEVVGQPAYMQTIFIEPEFVEVVAHSG
jgi:hypothetical protein